jgi:hypothetical protein
MARLCFRVPLTRRLAAASPIRIQQAALIASGQQRGSSACVPHTAAIPPFGASLFSRAYASQKLANAAFLACDAAPPTTATFKTKGLTDEQVESELATDDGKKLLQEIRAADPKASGAMVYARAAEQLSSFSEVPAVTITDSSLVKIVPRGEKISEYSPYFTTMSELDSVPPGTKLSDYFGLPCKSEADEYDVYEITPTSPSFVLVGKVAPTEEGELKKKAGAIQHVVPNRLNWSKPKFVKTIPNQRKR